MHNYVCSIVNRKYILGNYMQLRKIVTGSLLLLALLVACGQPSTSNSFGEVANQPHEHSADADHEHDDETPHDHADQDATGTSSELQPMVATSELVVGPNRMALGILENNAPIRDAAETRVHLRYFKLEGNQAIPAGEEEARFYGEGLGPMGTFIAYPTFDSPGTWGVELDIERPGQEPVTERLSLKVEEEGTAPIVGEPAPPIETPTADEVDDLRTITSDSDPDPRLYQMSVDEAITSGKPSLILFATPGYCQTAVCGPGVDVLQRLVDRFGDQINPVHVEVYQHPFEDMQPVPAMKEWGLQTEPWLFLVDENGTIVGRYEGGITYAELEPAVAELVDDQAGASNN
jgi:hypothetical protein